MKLTYSIYYPSGNATALVNQLVLEPSLKKLINDKIMSLNPQVEQVGFLSQRSYRLEMAGGEFCGNATRCAVFYYLKGKPGEINIKISGVRQKLKAGIDNQGNCWTKIPLQKNLITKKLGYTIINLEGITQVVTDSSPGKIKAKNILNKLGLLDSVPAAGVMFISKNRSEIKLNPFVWVRDIKTFFYETACASGTAAVGYYLAQKLNRSLKLAVVQPSKETLNVAVKLSPNNLPQAKISGSIKILQTELCIRL